MDDKIYCPKQFIEAIIIIEILNFIWMRRARHWWLWVMVYNLDLVLLWEYSACVPQVSHMKWDKERSIKTLLLGRGLVSRVQCRRIFAPFPILKWIRFQTKKTILACPPFKGFNTLAGFSVIHTPPSPQTCKSRHCVGVSPHPSCEVSDSCGERDTRKV